MARQEREDFANLLDELTPPLRGWAADLERGQQNCSDSASTSIGTPSFTVPSISARLLFERFFTRDDVAVGAFDLSVMLIAASCGLRDAWRDPKAFRRRLREAP